MRRSWRHFYVLVSVGALCLGGVSQVTPGAAQVDLRNISRAAVGAEPTAPFTVVAYSSPDTMQLAGAVGGLKFEDIDPRTVRVRPPFSALLGHPIAEATLAHSFVTLTASTTTKATTAVCLMAERQRSLYDAATAAVTCTPGRAELVFPDTIPGAPIDPLAWTLLWDSIGSLKPDRLMVESPDRQLMPFDVFFFPFIDSKTSTIAPQNAGFFEGWEPAPAPVIAAVVAKGAKSGSVVAVYPDETAAGQAVAIVGRAFREATSPVMRLPLRDTYGVMTATIRGRVVIYRIQKMPFAKINKRDPLPMFIVGPSSARGLPGPPVKVQS